MIWWTDCARNRVGGGGGGPVRIIYIQQRRVYGFSQAASRILVKTGFRSVAGGPIFSQGPPQLHKKIPLMLEAWGCPRLSQGDPAGTVDPL